MTVRKFLDLCTSHLQEETCRDLNSFEGIRADRTRYGWLMYASANAVEYDESGEWPAELLPIVLYARERGCEYILFDRDAETVDALPTWEW